MFTIHHNIGWNIWQQLLVQKQLDNLTQHNAIIRRDALLISTILQNLFYRRKLIGLTFYGDFVILLSAGPVECQKCVDGRDCGDISILLLYLHSNKAAKQGSWTWEPHCYEIIKPTRISSVSHMARDSRDPLWINRTKNAEDCTYEAQLEHQRQNWISWWRWCSAS